MRHVDETGLVGFEFLAERDGPLAGHVLRAEGPGDPVFVVVVAADGVVLTDRRGDDGLGEKEVRVAEHVAGLLGDGVGGVAGQRELRARLGVLDGDAVTDQRRVDDRHERHVEAAGAERLERRLVFDGDAVEVVELRANRVGDALAGDRVDLVGRVDREVVEEAVDVPEAVEMVEMYVSD